MKIIESLGHQGDTQWFAAEIDLSTLKKVDPTFVATSERSGSVHALCGEYDMYEVRGEDEQLSGYAIDVKGNCVLNHCFKKDLPDLRSNVIAPKKDHRHSEITPQMIPAGTVLFCGIQREFNPRAAGWRRTKD